MGVIAEDTATPAAVETPAPAAEPIAPVAGGDNGGGEPVSDSAAIAEFNKSVEAGLNEADEPAVETPPAVEEGAEVDTPAGEDEPAPAEEGATGDEPTPIVFAADDAPEIYAEKKKAVLDSVDLTEAPAVQALIDHQEAKIVAQGEVLGQLEAIANKDQLIKVGSAMNSLFETEIVDGEVKVNAAPLVNLFKSDFKDEFRPIAEEFLGTDSAKYQGASLLEEILIDNFGAEKAQKMVGYGFHDQPLPVVAQKMTLPAAVDPKTADAYWKMPEVERFEIQSLTDEIIGLEADMKDGDLTDWRKEEVATTLRDRREKLAGKINIINDVQHGIDAQKATEERTVRQNQENAIRFRNTVTQEYNGEVFELADTFAKDLAPRLTYADADTQLSQARNVMSRVNNALAFVINDDGSTTEDPMAEFYAKQLSEEGLKYDFNKGRDLLKQHYKATEKVTALKLRQASPQHIEIAIREKNKIMFDIKTEQKQLLGQLASRYVKSNGAALGKQVDAITAKKQAVKAIVPGRAATSTTVKPIKDEIAEYNRELAATTGEELYDFHTQ